MRLSIPVFISISLFLAACSPQSVSSTEVTQVTVVPEEAVVTSPVEEVVTETVDPQETPTPLPSPNSWMEIPAVPVEISARTKEIFVAGQAQGNNADIFIKIGDSNSTTTWFLGPIGRGDCSLGNKYEYLQSAADAFEESFLRNSVTVGRGFNASTALSSLWADKEQCEPKETPLDCEMRLMKPAYALVMLGTNDYTRMDQFELNMRIIIEHLSEAGIVPILSTKADNLEGDHSVNQTIAKLASEYEVPLWNLWAALQPLENQGAQLDDPAHLTWAGCDFEDPRSMESGSAWRNLTALEVINKVWRDVQ